MSERETARDIDDAAAAWAVRLQEHAEEGTAELEEWLAGDRRRAGALLRAEAALSLLDRGRALGAPARLPPSRPRFFGRISRRQALFGGIGAGTAAALAGVLAMIASGRQYETVLGEIRQVPLADGSITTINTSSEIAVTLQPNIRKIDLVRGEAWFKVAKDSARPFVVAVGQVRVRAVGTAFSVRRRDSGADVLVTEGVVETWVLGAEDMKLQLGAGKTAFVSDSAPPRVAALGTSEIDRSLAWRGGQISLGGETLSDAASEFNRYNRKKIVITDTGLASQKVVGRFRTDEPEAFATAVAGTFGATVIDNGAAIRISRSGTR
ncbi:MAG TPA: FecR domain-containing protein [Alphaproteobacteria bacterium]|nr:FecR domain-containing protein [Alphaproteobacteria bacterium]